VKKLNKNIILKFEDKTEGYCYNSHDSKEKVRRMENGKNHPDWE
jgi:hypothetical protein